jgi:hypothetical protein
MIQPPPVTLCRYWNISKQHAGLRSQFTDWRVDFTVHQYGQQLSVTPSSRVKNDVYNGLEADMRPETDTACAC